MLIARSLIVPERKTDMPLGAEVEGTGTTRNEMRSHFVRTKCRAFCCVLPSGEVCDKRILTPFL